MSSGPFDVFVSYHHANRALARRIVDALREQGLAVFFDEHEIQAFSSITARLRDGLAQAKALVVLYSETYPTRRACQFELTAAFLAAQRLGVPERRVLVLNPEAGSQHIEPVELRDAQYQSVSETDDDAAFTALAERVGAHVERIDGLLGDGAPITPPRWIGMRASAATRFVGRHAAMWKVHSALHAGDLQPMTGLSGPAVAEICGLGGIGKTLLAQEYALRFGAAFPGGVFWLRAGGDTVGDGLDASAIEAARVNQVGALAAEYEASLGAAPTPAERCAALAQALGREGLPFLWVVDDVPSGLTTEELRTWFAPHPLGRTLITTRSRTYGALAASVEPSVLSPEDAVALLHVHREPSGAQEAKEVGHLAKDLGYHTLAIDVAGAAVAAMPDAGPYASFRASLADPEDDVLEFAAELADVLPTGHTPSIAATLLASISTLGADGVDVLRAAAVLAVAPIPATFVAAVLAQADGSDARRAARRVAKGRTEARQASLIEPTGDHGADLVHALVSHTVRFRMGADGAARIAQLQEAAIAVLNDMRRSAGDTHAAQRTLQPLLPHARRLAETVTDDDAGVELLGWLAAFDRADGAYPAARALEERVLEARQRKYGEDHAATLTATGNLATTLQLLGELDEARALREQVLDARRRLFGEEDPATITAMGNLAFTLWAQADFAAARALEEQVLEARQRQYGEDHPATLTAMNNLAGTLHNQGELEQTRTLRERVLEGRVRLLGEEHPETLQALGNLAGTLHDQGEHERARVLLERVLEASTRLLGEDHPDTLLAMSNLAGALDAQEDHPAARALKERVLEGRVRLLGEEHPDTLLALGGIASTLVEQGEYERARVLLERVLEASTRLLGEEHPDTLLVMSNLAGALHRQGEYERAQVLLEQVLEGRMRLLGEEHPDTLFAMSNLAATLFEQGERETARVLLERALEASGRVLGEEHPNTVRTMENLATVLLAQGASEPAQALMEQAMAVRRPSADDEP